MSEQLEMMETVLKSLCKMVRQLSPGDLIAYREILAGLEQLTILSDGFENTGFTALALRLKEVTEDMIQGRVDDQQSGVDSLRQGFLEANAVFEGQSSVEEPGDLGNVSQQALEATPPVADEPDRRPETLINDLASHVMLLEPGDLAGYGEMLVIIEELATTSQASKNADLAPLAVCIKDEIEALIFDDPSDHGPMVERLSQGISLCQSLIRKDAGASQVDDFIAHAPGAETAEPGPDSSQTYAPDNSISDQASRGQAALSPAESPAGPDRASENTGEAGQGHAGTPVFLKETVPCPDDQDLLIDFTSEAAEHLESIEVNTLVIEDSPEDTEALNAVFRSFHTIKGVSGFLNLGDTNHLAHALENLLDKARSGALIIDCKAVDVILAGVDHLRRMLDEALTSTREARPRRLMDTSALEARVAAVLKANPRNSSEPEPLGKLMVGKGLATKEAVDKALARQKQEQRPLGELLVHMGEAQPHQVAEGLRQQKTKCQTSRGQAQSVKIDTRKLDNLLDMVGELVITQSMIQANPSVQSVSDRKLHSDMAQLARITTDLQKSTMSMRMVPIKQTFQKMARVVRDTAQKAGKTVHLELVGESTEIDRNMVEKFYDPLMHMVRNSVDHGVEPPDKREALKKPAQGTVTLSAYHQGGSVCVKIQDDGRGLDRKAIAAKAIERGLLDSDEGMSDSEVFSLIMRPGFSTAEKITEISGRGVGMDVVQKTVDELRGNIHIASEPGRGSTFTIALPLTLAIIDGMVVEVGEEKFILPTISVSESLRPSKKDYSTVQGKGEMIMIRGSLLPLLRLHQVVGAEPKCRHPWEGLVVVVEHNGAKQCLMVDNLVNRQEVVIKSLGQSLKHINVLAGGAIMGDGRVGLILDVEGIIKARKAFTGSAV